MKRLRMFLFFAVMTVVFAEGRLFAATPMAQAAQGQEIRTGVFYLVEGLSYQAQTLDGITNNKGEFRYRPSEDVTFSIGGFILGSAPGAQRLTSAHLVPSVYGDVTKIKEPKATNLARFVQSLDEDGNVENGITITAQTREVVTQYNRKIDFAKSETAFSEEPNVVALFTKLNKTLRSPAQARNYERWTLLGVQSATNVKIPMRDGNYVVAKVFRPIDDGKYPPLVVIGEYGMTNFRGCSCNPKERLEEEARLDRFFEGNPDNLRSESFEIPDAHYWVPKGYVIIRVDARGVCNTPGVFHPYSVQQAEDYYDSIEWAAEQPWSNGNVGTYAASLYGINMFTVASLQPPHLKAMYSIVGDANRYRDVVYTGGILNLPQRLGWLKGVIGYRCLGQKTFEDTVGDWGTYWLAHPFDEAPWYGTYDVKPPLEMNADLSKVVVPFISVPPLEHGNHQHAKGAIEAYIGAASKDKQLRVINGDNLGSWMYAKEGLEESEAFLDHWLKGIDNGVMNGPKVRLTIRTGDGGWYWQNENEYPIARTEYRKYYLDAVPSSWAGDGKRSDFMKLSTTEPAAKASKSYSADVKVGAVPCWAPGVSFVSEPLTADMVLAGWIKVHLWVSATSSDSDIFASLRVMDKNNQEIPYALQPGVGYYPVGKGWQRVSHRVLDENKSTIYRPWPTHTKADYAPLKSPDEVVPVDVELHPTTALVRKGDRIRLDIQPVDGCDFGSPHYYDASYHQGASNTIYTGADHSSYVQLPVIPPK